MVTHRAMHWTISILTFVFLCGCDKVADSGKPNQEGRNEGSTDVQLLNLTRATITRHVFTESGGPPETTVIEAPGEVIRLAGFFPGLGTGKSSDDASTWEPECDIVFERRSGAPLRISTDIEGVWSEGRGDWPLKAGFREYLEERFKTPPAKESPFVEARITQYFTLALRAEDQAHLDSPKKTVVKSSKEVQRLAAFFPSMGEGKKTPDGRSGGWITFARIEFVLRTHGAVNSVSVDPDLEEWAEGEGDWPLSDEFGPFLFRLLEKEEAQQPN